MVDTLGLLLAPGADGEVEEGAVERGGADAALDSAVVAVLKGSELIIELVDGEVLAEGASDGVEYGLHGGGGGGAAAMLRPEVHDGVEDGDGGIIVQIPGLALAGRFLGHCLIWGLGLGWDFLGIN